MSDRFRPTPESIAKAARFAVNHPKITRVGALALSATLATTTITPEGQIPLTKVKIGSFDPQVMEQLKDNHGAILRGGPSTTTMPVARAPIGEAFSVIEVVEDGSWVKVSLDPKENIPDIDMNYGLLPVNKKGHVIIPTEVYISRPLVKEVFPKPSK